MAIFITGDCHGDFKRFSNKNFNYSNCTKDKDYIIICGDFGGIWTSGQNWKGKDYIGRESNEDKYWLNWLSAKPVTFIIVGGNHENYNFIEEYYSIEKFNGAKVRKIRNNIIWVERGEIIELNNKKFFCFGGAQSTDKKWRIIDKTWWSRELPNEYEYKKLNNFIDDNIDNNIYIITHECPSNIKAILFPNIALIEGFDKFSCELIRLYDKYNWKHWFCGHLHLEENKNKISLMYENIYKMEE